MSGEQTQNEAVVPAPGAEATAALVSVESTPGEQTQVEGQQAAAAPKTFTQEELDRIVAKEKAKERRRAEKELTRRAPEAMPHADIPDDKLTPEQAVERRAHLLAQQKAAEAEAKRQREEFESREDDAREKYPDYDQVFTKDTPVSETMAQVIVASDFGPDLAYFLGQNPKEAARIFHLPPVQQAREMGKIEAKLAEKPATPAKVVSSAPAPITPVTPTGTSRVVDTTDPRSLKDMSPSEWIEADRARRREKLLAQRKR